MNKPFEVHKHTFVSGPRANGMFIQAKQETTSTFHHSHEGGDQPHEHPNTGPACYVIDKDEWARTTGLRGGGRKTFTAKPSGEQMPYVERTENTFEIIYCDQPTGPQFDGFEGGGFATAARMVLGHKLTPVIRDHRSRR